MVLLFITRGVKMLISIETNITCDFPDGGGGGVGGGVWTPYPPSGSAHVNSRDLRVHNENLIFLFLNQNICCGYSKEPSQRDGSFEHPKLMLKLMGKKIFTFLC